MSTGTSAAARAASTEAATPGWSGTPATVRRTSPVSCAMLETWAFSMSASGPSSIQVPAAGWKAERTCRRTL